MRGAQNCSTCGREAVKSVLRLFDELVKCDEEGKLKDVRDRVIALGIVSPKYRCFEKYWLNMVSLMRSTPAYIAYVLLNPLNVFQMRLP